MKAALYLLPLLAGASVVRALPPLPSKKDAQPSISLASHASQLIATQLLKHNKDIDANQVYSPLGVASILGALAEAAEGETYEEFGKVFGFPKQREDLRASYERIMASLHNGHTSMGMPSFQNWFYYYRNNSVREDYKQLLQTHYFTEVKDVSGDKYDWAGGSLETTAEEIEGDADRTESSNSKDVIGFETLKRINLDDEAPIGDTYGEEVLNKEASKFDRDVDDKQYVEKPVALAEAEQMLREQEQLTTEQPADADAASGSTDAPVEKLEKPADIALKAEENLADKQQTKRSDAEENANVEENETVLETEKVRKLPNQVTASEPEKMRLPLQKLENAVKTMVKDGADEIMIALESHLSSVSRAYAGRTLFQKDDIASALSANSITGRALDARTKMLIFNGLYYRGSWAQPFYMLRDGSDEFFFMTNEDAMKTPMMHSRAKYYVADLPHLKARLLSIPYENSQYSLCIMLPNDPEGLTEAIAQMEPSDYKYAQEHMQLKELHVTLPKFSVMDISHAEGMLQQLGLKRLFSPTDVQLGRLSEDKDLFVKEIVQFVSVRVDESSTSTNSLTGNTVQARSPSGEESTATLPVPEPEPEPGVERFDVNRPFAYFIVDCTNQFVITSGKVYAPAVEDDLPPVTVEVELEQS